MHKINWHNFNISRRGKARVYKINKTYFYYKWKSNKSFMYLYHAGFISPTHCLCAYWELYVPIDISHNARTLSINDTLYAWSIVQIYIFSWHVERHYVEHIMLSSIILRAIMFSVVSPLITSAKKVRSFCPILILIPFFPLVKHLWPN